MCDRYVARLEGESPLRAPVGRTVREGKGVHREMLSDLQLRGMLDSIRNAKVVGSIPASGNFKTLLDR
jgi:hypothetical protein